MNIVPTRATRATGLARMRDEMDSLFRRFLDDFETPLWGGSWLPALDVAERDDAFLVKAELPGMKNDDIDISVQGNVLSISGEKKESAEEKDKNYYHVERRFGSFRRDVTLPAGVDANKIEADYRDGVLTVVLPKSESAKPRRIKIK